MPVISPNASTISGIFIHRTADMITSLGPLGFPQAFRCHVQGCPADISPSIDCAMPEFCIRAVPMHRLCMREKPGKTGISRPRGPAEVPGEVPGHRARVVFDAADER